MLSLTVLLMYLSPASAANEPVKEEVIYVTLNAAGQADAAYVVNIFPGGVVTDYGNYTSVRTMNTEDNITYTNGLVSFVSADSRVYYQGNMAQVELPWLFDLTWTLNGRPVTAGQMAGATGNMEMKLSISQNPACSGNFFDTHALQITASLDTDRCTNIVSEGATHANVGSVCQLNWIILPGMASNVILTANVTDFEMPALSINGVRMQLDPGDEVIENVLSLVDGLEELSSHNAELTDGARQLVEAVFETANAELQANKAAFEMLGITLIPLTMENYDEEITRLQTELLDNVDEYVLQQADRQLRSQVNSAAAAMVRAEVEKAARAQVEQEVRKAAEQQVRDAVTAEARKQVEAAVRNPSDADIEALVDAQMQTAEVQAMIDANVEAQMASPEVQTQINAEIEAIARPQVEAAAEAEVRHQVEAAVRLTVRLGIEKTMEAKIRAEVSQEMGGSGLPSTTPDISDIIEALPTLDPSITDQLPDIDGDDVQDLIEALPTLDPSILEQLPEMDADDVQDLIEALPTLDPSILEQLSEMDADEVKDLIASLIPSATPTLPAVQTPAPTTTPSPLPTDPPSTENGFDPSILEQLRGVDAEDVQDLIEALHTLDPSVLEQLPDMDAEDVMDLIASLVPSATPTLPVVQTPAPTTAPTAEASAEPTAGTATEPTAEPTTTPTAEPTAAPTAEATAAPTELPAIEDVLDAILNPESTFIPSIDPSVVPTLPPFLNPTDETNTTTFTDLFSFLLPSAKAEECSLSQQIEEEVAARMASPEVQQQIDALTDAAMASEATQTLINAQVSSQMQSPEVQAMIEAEVAAQVADPDNRAQAEAAARAEVRRQVEAVAREQVRAAVYAQLGTMTEDDFAAMVDGQMQSAAVQKMIEDEVAVQMQSAEVQAMINAEIENQMQSDEVQALINAECAKQMQSSEVQSQISSEIYSYRNSAAYLDSVAEALEANGENGEAYQALVTLRETLDDVMSFYNGLVDYTDGVGEAASGVDEARVEVEALLGDVDGENVSETISFTSEKNGAVKSVQFVITVPAIEKTEETIEEQADTAEDTFIDKLLQLFQ